MRNAHQASECPDVDLLIPWAKENDFWRTKGERGDFVVSVELRRLRYGMSHVNTMTY